MHDAQIMFFFQMTQVIVQNHAAVSNQYLCSLINSATEHPQPQTDDERAL
jgi:hypothetical protein